MDPWSSFIASLGAVGPVGLFALAALYLWLKMGRPHRDAGIVVQVMSLATKATEALEATAEHQRRAADHLERIEQHLQKGGE